MFQSEIVKKRHQHIHIVDNLPYIIYIYIFV